VDHSISWPATSLIQDTRQPRPRRQLSLSARQHTQTAYRYPPEHLLPLLYNSEKSLRSLLLLDLQHSQYPAEVPLSSQAQYEQDCWQISATSLRVCDAPSVTSQVQSSSQSTDRPSPLANTSSVVLRRAQTALVTVDSARSSSYIASQAQPHVVPAALPSHKSCLRLPKTRTLLLYDLTRCPWLFSSSTTASFLDPQASSRPRPFPSAYAGSASLVTALVGCLY
jgi:hypothetical protein